MTEIKNNIGIGQIQIADEVIAVIAGTAALEIDGVAGMSGNFTGDLVEKLGHKNLSKGIKIDVSGGNVTVGISIMAKFGYKIHELSTDVQKRVKTAIETMTGLTVAAVNVHITGIHHEKEKPKEYKEFDDE